MFSGTIPNHEVSVNPQAPKKTYIRVPAPDPSGRRGRLSRALGGVFLSPIYWLLALLYRGPGLRFRLRCAALGVHLLYKRNAQVSYSDISMLLFWPIDSVRYFEFDFMWRTLSEASFHNYLDVSSPRLFPVLLLRERPDISAEFVNPDKSDLQSTALLVNACGLESRCRLWNGLIEDAPFAPESFDAITSISVIEHIRDDANAIKTIWALLKPGGRLLLSLPCGSVAEQEFVNLDFFGLQTPDEEGFFFHQYRYDYPLLEDRIYSVVGRLVKVAVYGERRPGTLLSWLLQKWARQRYPLWKEPYAVAREFQYYESVSDLPGEGVIAMEFVKK
jgi:SAM-dependent methyltransferase